jgi:hypothetical protein
MPALTGGHHYLYQDSEVTAGKKFYPEAINFTLDPSPQVEASFQSHLKFFFKSINEVLNNRQCLLFELFLLSWDRNSVAHHPIKH